LAKKVTDLLLDSGEQVWGLSVLPKKDQLPGTVRYYKVDAMGLDFMHNTYTAQYLKSGTLVTVFLSQRESPDSARATKDKYSKYAKKYGRGIDHLRIDGVEFVSCNMGGDHDVIFQKGRIIGGVLSVQDQDVALRVASELEAERSTRRKR